MVQAWTKARAHVVGLAWFAVLVCPTPGFQGTSDRLLPLTAGRCDPCNPGPLRAGREGGGWHKALVVGSVTLWRRLLTSLL